MLATLPKMAKAAQNEELRAAFEKHEAETEDQVGRLEQIFAAIDKKPQGKTCAAIVGITDEGAEIMKEYKGSPALDAGLLAAAQAVVRPNAPRAWGRRALKAWRSRRLTKPVKAEPETKRHETDLDPGCRIRTLRRRPFCD